MSIMKMDAKNSSKQKCSYEDPKGVGIHSPGNHVFK